MWRVEVVGLARNDAVSKVSRKVGADPSLCNLARSLLT